MRIILAIFTDRFEVYGSLKPFFEQYPQYEKRIDSINDYLSRKKTAFEDDFIKIERKEVVR